MPPPWPHAGLERQDGVTPGHAESLVLGAEPAVSGIVLLAGLLSDGNPSAFVPHSVLHEIDMLPYKGDGLVQFYEFYTAPAPELPKAKGFAAARLAGPVVLGRVVALAQVGEPEGDSPKVYVLELYSKTMGACPEGEVGYTTPWLVCP